MVGKFKHAVLIACAGACYFTPLLAHADVSPEIMNILKVAAHKNGGQHFNVMVDMLISANPENEADIRAAAQALAPKTAVVEVAPPPPAPAPSPAAKKAYHSLWGWDGEVELNILATTGNSQQKSFGIGSKMKKDRGLFHHTVTAFFDFNKNSGVKNKQKYGLGYKMDYDFTERSYITGFAGYENDQFGPFRERITLSAGYGYRVIDNDNYSWDVEAGPGLLVTKDLPGADYESEFTGFANSLFNWTISDRSNLENNTSFYFGSRNVIESKSALKVKINGSLSSKFSYDILYDKNAPIGRKTTDSIARAGLLYDF